jgi:hypothetical protein
MRLGVPNVGEADEVTVTTLISSTVSRKLPTQITAA